MVNQWKRTLAGIAAGMAMHLAAVAQAVDGHVWVAGHGSQSLVKIRKADNAVAATIALPGMQPFGVSVDSASVWATAYNGNSVARVNKGSGSVATVPLGSHAWAVATDPESAWVTTADVMPIGVARISKASGTQDAFVPLPSPAWGVAVDANAVWVAGEPSLYRIDKASLTVTSAPVLTIPRGIAVDAAHVWVADFASLRVLRIDKATLAVTLAIDTGAYGLPHGIAVNDTHVWVACYAPGRVLKIDKVTGAVVAVGDVPAAGPPPYLHGIALDDDAAWTDSYDTGLARRIDLATGAVVASTPVGATPATFGDSTGAAYDALFGPPPPFEFASFAAKLDLRLAAGGTDRFELKARFTLAAGSDGIEPLAEALSVQVGPASVTIPAGAFREKQGSFRFAGTRGIVVVESAKLTPLGGGAYELKLEVSGVELGEPPALVPVAIVIRNDEGGGLVKADR